MFFSVSLFAGAVIKEINESVPKSWNGIWTISAISQDEGASLQDGRNQMFGIMSTNKLLKPNIGTDYIDKVKIVQNNELTFYVVTFTNVTDKFWYIEEYSATSLKLIVYTMTGEEVARFLIEISGN
jgi:hypothetical protein